MYLMKRGMSWMKRLSAVVVNGFAGNMFTLSDRDRSAANFQLLMLLRPRLSVLLLVCCLASCAKEPKPPLPPQAAAPAKPATTPTAPEPAVRYRMVHLNGTTALLALIHGMDPPQMALLFKLNRRDLKHLKSGDSVVVPTATDSLLAYSPFPQRVDSSITLPKLLVISRRVQAFAAYEHGRLVQWGPTSTGKKTTPTPAGLYHTNWKSKETHSTVDDAWVLKWYFNLDNLEGISMHEYDLPGYPASHSCVRLLPDDAEWIYNWADQWKLSPNRSRVETEGTPVVVFGEDAYGHTPPWKLLASDPEATTVSQSDSNSAVQTYVLLKVAHTPDSTGIPSTSTKGANNDGHH
jgi:lipoprotein-anchoring transpeptidase ErfK/SrfK